MQGPEQLTHRGWFPMFRADADAILDNFADSKRKASAAAVYMALCRLANDAKAASFEARIARIGKLAGVGYRTAIERLHDLADIGILTIETKSQADRPHPDAPSRYTLRRYAEFAGGYANERVPVLPTVGNNGTIPTQPVPPVVGEFQPFITRFRAIRPEFANVRDFQIAEAIRAFPAGPVRDQAFTEFERDADSALQCPPNPLKMLRGYLSQATKPRKGVPHDHQRDKRAGEFAEPTRPIREL